MTDPDAPTPPPAKNRTKSGRFKKGESANPSGRKRGSRNRSTVMLEAMTADDRATIVAKIIAQARKGCRASQKLIVDRLEPPRRARVRFKLLPIASIADIVPAFDHIAAAVAQGILTLEEAASASIIIEKTREGIITRDLVQKIAALEARFQS